MAPPTSRPSLPPGPALRDLSPMVLATGRPFSHPDWIYEVKMDGYRLLAEWDANGAYLQSRNGADATRWFPEITTALAGVDGGRFVTDGEVCVVDDIGRSDFSRLHARARMRGYRPGADLVAYFVFDLLVDSGKSVMGLPLAERKNRLAKLFRGKPPSILVVGAIDTQGEALYSQALALKLERIVAKRKDSTYTPGVRTTSWLKIKRPGGTPAQRFDREPIEPFG